MKQLIGSLLFVVMLLAASPVKSQIRFGVKGGVNIASVKFNKDIVSTENITGYHLGPMLEFIAPVAGVGIDLAVLYSTKGVSLKPLKEEMLSFEKEIVNRYIDVPVNLKWKFGIPVIKGYLAAGPYVSFRVGGNKLSRIYDDVQQQLKAKSFAAGVNVGGGIELFNSLQLGLTYGIGLTDDYSAGSLNAKNRIWSITAAYLF